MKKLTEENSKLYKMSIQLEYFDDSTKETETVKIPKDFRCDDEVEAFTLFMQHVEAFMAVD